MTALTTPQQREIAQSMLEDQNECLTVARLVAALQISRTNASRLLTELCSSSKTPTDATVIVTSNATANCHHNKSNDMEDEGWETVPCTVFSFKKQTTQPFEKDDSTFLYAIAPRTDATTSGKAESFVSSSHEQTLAQWRDWIRNRDTQQLQACVQASQDVIQSAESKEELEARWEQYRQPSTDLGAMSVSHATSSNSMAFKKKKAAVGAAAYFGANGKTKESKKTTTSSGSSSKVKDAKASTAKSSRSSAASSKNSSTLPKALKPVAKGGIVAGIRKASKLAQEEKENENKQISRKKIEEKKSIGNADDFVGDVDDDDDDDDSYQAPQKEEEPVAREFSRNSNNARQSQTADIDDDDDSLQEEEEDKDSTAKSEPMQIEQPQPKRRRRRKKLVQKTTVDESGYLHTETQEIWEEIPSDEEAEKPKAAAPARKPAVGKSKKQPPKKKGGKAKGGMKQGSLHSFFKK